MLIIRFSFCPTLVLLLLWPYNHKWTNIQGRPLASPPLASSCFLQLPGCLGRRRRGRQQERRGSLTRLGTAITFMRGDGLIIKICCLIWSLSGEVWRLQPLIRHKSLDWSICGDVGEGEGERAASIISRKQAFDFLKRVFCVQWGGIKILCEEYFASLPFAHNEWMLAC